MRKLLILFLAFFPVLSFGQQILDYIPQNIGLIPVKSKKIGLLHGRITPKSFSKTASACDTVVKDSSYFVNDVEPRCLSDSINLNGVTVNQGGVQKFGGYLLGTQTYQTAYARNPKTGDTYEITSTLHQVGLNFDINSPTAKIRIIELFFPFLGEKLYKSVVVKEPDVFYARVYGGTRDTGPEIDWKKPGYNQIGKDQPFKIPDLEVNNHGFVFETPIELDSRRLNYFIAVEVRNRTSDDTLAFYNTNPRLGCGGRRQGTWVQYVDTVTWSRDSLKWIVLYRIFDGPNADKSKPPVKPFDADMLLLPVVELVNFHGCTSRDFDENRYMQSKNLKLYGIYPNPVSAGSKVKFGLSSPGLVSFKVWDATGREVSTIDPVVFGVGNHQLPLSNYDLPSGVYYFTVTTEEGQITTKFNVAN